MLLKPRNDMTGYEPAKGGVTLLQLGPLSLFQLSEPQQPLCPAVLPG